MQDRMGSPVPTRRVSAIIGAAVIAATAAGAFAVPSMSAAAQGTFEGNTTRELDEPLTFKVTKNKTKAKKAKRNLEKAKRKAKRADNDKKAQKSVKRAKRNLKKAKRPIVKDFAMQTVVLECTETDGPGGPPIGQYFGVQSVPQGSLFAGKNAAKVDAKGEFSIDFSSNRNLDEGQHSQFKGKLSGDSAEGKLDVMFTDYFNKCTSGVRPWVAAATG